MRKDIARLGRIFFTLKISIIIIVSTHFLAPGLIPFLDLFGYLLLICGMIALYKADSNKDEMIYKWIMLSAVFGGLASAAGYILFRDADQSGSALEIAISSIIAASDLASVLLLCKSFYDRGIKFKSPQVCESSVNTQRCIISIIAAFMFNSFQGYLPFEGYAALFLDGGVKIIILVLTVYIYKYISVMFNSIRDAMELYDESR